MSSTPGSSPWPEPVQPPHDTSAPPPHGGGPPQDVPPRPARTHAPGRAARIWWWCVGLSALATVFAIVLTIVWTLRCESEVPEDALSSSCGYALLLLFPMGMGLLVILAVGIPVGLLLRWSARRRALREGHRS